MTTFTKISAIALFSLCLTACDKPADKAADTPKVETTQTENSALAASLSDEKVMQAKADLKKILEWNRQQEQIALAAQQKLKEQLDKGDPKLAETALLAFKQSVDDTVKSLDAVEVTSPLVVAFKDKTKEVMVLSSDIVSDSINLMTASNATPEAQRVLSEKTEKLTQEGNELKKLQEELQQLFGE